MLTKKPYNLKGKELEAYRRGFCDGEESNYFPCLSGRELFAYDWGYKDAQKYGVLKGSRGLLDNSNRGRRG